MHSKLQRNKSSPHGEPWFSRANFHFIKILWLVSRNTVQKFVSRTLPVPEGRKLPRAGSRQPSSSRMRFSCSQLFWLRAYKDLKWPLEKNSNSRYLFCLGFLILYINCFSSFTDGSRYMRVNTIALRPFTYPLVPAAVTGPREPGPAKPCWSKTVSPFEHWDSQISSGLETLFLSSSVIKEHPAPLAWKTGQNALNLGILRAFFLTSIALKNH